MLNSWLQMLPEELFLLDRLTYLTAESGFYHNQAPRSQAAHSHDLVIDLNVRLH